MEITSENRVEVLMYSLLLEYEASFSLAYLLDIPVNKISKSKSLGNLSSALSFNQKINLLLDNKSISSEEKQKLVHFMSIRNQFMHNYHADTYEQCASHIDGLTNYLKRVYADCFEKMPLESALRECVSRLFNEGLETLREFKGGKENKLTIESERDVYETRSSALKEAIDFEINALAILLEGETIMNKVPKEISILVRQLRYKILLKAQQLIVDKTE